MGLMSVPSDNVAPAAVQVVQDDSSDSSVVSTGSNSKRLVVDEDSASKAEPSAGRELEASKEMCYYCFDVLLEHLMIMQHGGKQNMSGTNAKLFSLGLFSGTASSTGRQMNNSGAASTALNESSSSSILDYMSLLSSPDAACPLFVTWDKYRANVSGARRAQIGEGGTFSLRGCIGTLTPRPLKTAIREYAVMSALKDTRFDPIHVDEIPHLRVAVSLLVDYEDCPHGNVHDWVVGTHGIVIEFVHAGRSYSATYLPEVAKEQRWTQVETIKSLVRKAGYHGDVTPQFIQSSNMTCTRYQSSKVRCAYDEYVQVRHDGNDPLLSLMSQGLDYTGTAGASSYTLPNTGSRTSTSPGSPNGNKKLTALKNFFKSS